MASLAAQADVALLGPDELHQHQQLLQLEADLQACVQRIITTASSAPPATTGGQHLQLPSVTDRELQQHLAKLRSQIRDLELLAEEQEL